MAVWAFAEQKFSEGQLAELIEVDRLTTRERVPMVLDACSLFTRLSLENLVGNLSWTRMTAGRPNSEFGAITLARHTRRA